MKTNFKAYKASAEEKVDENSDLPSSNTTSAQQNNLFDELGQLVQSTVSSLINSTFFAIGLSGRYQLCPSLNPIWLIDSGASNHMTGAYKGSSY